MELTPLTEIHPAVCNLADIIPDYGQPEKIGLNMQRLGGVAAWGGFFRDKITIMGYAGERSSINTSVIGFGGPGEAVGGAASANVASLGSGEAINGGGLLWRSRAELKLRVNSTELVDRVQSSGQLRDPSNWARHIDSALTTGLREAAWKHLTGRPLPLLETGTALGGTALESALYATLASAEDNFTAGGMVLSVIGGLVISPNLIRVLTVLDRIRPARGMFPSILPVFQFDRLAMVNGLSRTLRFAKVIR